MSALVIERACYRAGPTVHRATLVIESCSIASTTRCRTASHGLTASTLDIEVGSASRCRARLDAKPAEFESGASSDPGRMSGRVPEQIWVRAEFGSGPIAGASSGANSGPGRLSGRDPRVLLAPASSPRVASVSQRVSANGPLRDREGWYEAEMARCVAQEHHRPGHLLTADPHETYRR